MKVFVGIACVSYKIYSGTFESILNLQKILKENNIDLEVHIENGISIIDHARNKITKKFLESNSDYLLFIDDDIEFNGINILKMINTNCDVIGGIYPVKNYNWNRIIEASKNSYNIDEIKNYGLNYMFKNPINKIELEISDVPYEVDGVGTGCLLIKREVIEKLIINEEKYILNGIEYYRIFSIIIKDNEYISEDYNFCNKWKNIDGKVYIATFNKCNHWGIIKY